MPVFLKDNLIFSKLNSKSNFYSFFEKTSTIFRLDILFTNKINFKKIINMLIFIKNN